MDPNMLPPEIKQAIGTAFFLGLIAGMIVYASFQFLGTLTHLVVSHL